MPARAPRPTDPAAPHLPVLLGPLLQAVAPVRGVWADGTFGAGGYARGLLRAGAARVIGIDRDPDVFAMAADWAAALGDRLVLVQGEFARLDALAAEAGCAVLDGVVLDLGVSSMQVDRPERGFSFQKDGPLDMRMSQAGPDAAALIATAGEAELADILYHYGDERASRRIARAIVAARARTPITRTGELAEIVRGCLPRPRPGQADPATRSFQALRIAVNDELGQLAEGLAAAERALAPGGCLAVVTFHSTEDRIVKRYLADAADTGGRGSRHGPATPERAARFQPVLRGARAPDADEIAANPRARSARLRVARRTDAPAAPPARDVLGLPGLTHGGER